MPMDNNGVTDNTIGMMPMLAPMVSHDKKYHVSHQFDHLDLRNAVVTLKMLFTSCDAGTNTVASYDTLLRMFICKLAHQALTKNYFIFNKQLYIQKQGTAMGTRMAPKLCSHIHALLRVQLFRNYSKKTKDMA